EVRGLIGPPPDSFVLASTVAGGRLPAISMETYAFSFIPISTANGLSVSASASGAAQIGFSACMVAPDGGTPGVGLYEHAEANHDQLAGIPGLAVGSCSSTISGSFRILELEQRTHGTASRLAADIRQRCGSDATELFAAIRYKSALPFFNIFPIVTNTPVIVGPGTVVTWTAAASSGTGPVEYRFLR